MSELYAAREFCRGEAAWLRETIEALVVRESPTGDKAAVDRCGAELARRLEAIGARVTRLPQAEHGDHLRAEFDPIGEEEDDGLPEGGARDGRDAGPGERKDAARQILLLGHFDTVWPVGQLVRMPLAQRDGRLHGPGVFDMKAGIAIGMLAARALRKAASHAPRIVMLWTSDEEMGSGTSRVHVEAEARRSAAVLVLEPSLPGGAVKTARKGVGEYVLTVHGVAAHAGIEPEKGASAVHELAHQICRLYRLQKLSAGISINVAPVSGGTRPNVVADHARAIVDARAATSNEMRMIDGIIGRQRPRDPRTRLEVTGGFDRPPLERTAAVLGLYEQARGVARELGFELAEGATGGGSDGNFTAALGVPTLDGLGAIGGGAHALDEHIELAALPDRAALIAGLVGRLGAGYNRL